MPSTSLELAWSAASRPLVLLLSSASGLGESAAECEPGYPQYHEGVEHVSEYNTYHMIDLLMRKPAIVLQHIIVLSSCCLCDRLCNLEDLEELVVRDVCKLCAVVFRDNELSRDLSVSPQPLSIISVTH